MPGAAEPSLMLALSAPVWVSNIVYIGMVLLGFSLIIFFHELGHFLAAKWVGVRVDRFAVGFGPRVFGWRGGEGLTFGKRPDYTADELERLRFGETDYCFRALPLGGYVKMLGQEDIIIDDKTGEMSLSDDPRAFTSRPVGQRMIVVSAGVVFNLLLAAMLLAAIFMVGKRVTSTRVGDVPVDSNAYGKLLPGDEVLAVDGWRTQRWEDVMILSVFADGEPVDLQVRRDGQVVDLTVRPDPAPQFPGISLVIFEPERKPVVGADGQAFRGTAGLLRGDRIVAVDGRPVQTQLDLEPFGRSRGRPLTVTVERPGEDGAAPTRHDIDVLPNLALRGQRELGEEELPVGDVLGFVPLAAIEMVTSGDPAEQAGMQAGDVILEWGAIATPTYKEIKAAIVDGPLQPTRVNLLRAGEPREITLTARREFRLFEQAEARVGVVFGSYRGIPQVADIIPDSPAADLNMPRGALIETLAGQDITSWDDAIRIFLESAGETIAIRYRVGATLVDDELSVPSSLINEADLPPTAFVTSIAGQSEVAYTTTDGAQRTANLRSGPAAIRTLLRQHVGQTVEVRYVFDPKAPERSVMFDVRPDNVDPWQMRVRYGTPVLSGEPVKTLLHADGNPLVAMRMGATQVRDWVLQVYWFLKLTFVRSNPSLNTVSGPVGIVSTAVEHARSGIVELLHLLAFLSVNLAVINFLPIPVMDGGLMLFLIIEKIKGRPLSLKTQMVSTLVGLAAIILIGVIVTFQDVARLLS